jgi:hypothetical protein
MTDPIRAALDKARAVYCHADGECPCATPDDCSMKLRSGVPAKIIAAFLRALPMVLDNEFHLPNSWAGHPYPNFNALAQAVLAAAKDQGDD